MQKSKLGLDFDKVAEAKQLAQNIANKVQQHVEAFTTVTVERTLCRLIGIDGIDADEVPLPNILIDELKEKGLLAQGVLFHLANAMIETGLTPQQITEQLVEGKIDFRKINIYPVIQREEILKPYIQHAMERVSLIESGVRIILLILGEGPKPYIYVIVATGNIYEECCPGSGCSASGS